MLAVLVCVVVCLCGAAALPVPDARLHTRAMVYAELHPNTDPEPECDFALDEDDLASSYNAVMNKSRLWPGGIVPYTLDPVAQYTPEEIAKIEAGINDLIEKTKVMGQKCVDIFPWTGEENYIQIGRYGGCTSMLGIMHGMQRISLESGCVNRHGTIMHEFLHALGFYHEHQTWNRDFYVTINWDNIEIGKKTNFFALDEARDDTLGTSYDYSSVMHYGAYGFAVDPAIPTIIPMDPSAVIGQRTHLSAIDIERVQVLYGCVTPAESKYHKDWVE